MAQYTLMEVRKHNQPGDLWIVIDGNVLDVTKFLAAHPGGEAPLRNGAGKDNTELFNQLHDGRAKEMMKQYIIGKLKVSYSLAEVASHNSPNDLWVAINGKVYDVTQWQRSHPGGKQCFARVGGTDCSAGFNKLHDASMRTNLPKFVIGELSDGPPASSPLSPTSTERDSFVSFSLKVAASESFNTKRLIFKAERPLTSPLKPILPGGHLILRLVADGETVLRNYSPIRFDPSTAEFEIVCKRYPAGKGSGYLHQLSVGDSAKFSAPVEPAYPLFDRLLAAKALVLIGAGTGIAPIYTIAKTVAAAPQRVDKVVLLSCFRNEEEILLEEEMAALVKANSALQSTFLLSQQAEPCKKPHGMTTVLRMDHVSAENCAAAGAPRQWSDGVDVVCCGPPKFNDAVLSIFTQKLGYPSSAVFVL